MNLSDKQLLLLDTFMYSDIVTKKEGFSGEMDAEKMADVMNEVLADEEL